MKSDTHHDIERVLNISLEDLRRACRAFREGESRDAIYKIATRIVAESWPENMTDTAEGIGVLLLVWNQAFYRWSNFTLDYDALEGVLRKYRARLHELRQRKLLTFSREDEEAIRGLFDAFLDALKLPEGKRKGARSPVSVAKGLHLIAPNFFPLWDDEIAKTYGTYWSGGSAGAAAKYVAFTWATKAILERILSGNAPTDTKQHDLNQPWNQLAEELSRLAAYPKSLLKFLDEYNYAKHTRGWI